MELHSIAIFFSCFLIFTSSNGREQLKQQGDNPNADFISHETARNAPVPKRDYVAPQFPTLSTPASGSTQNMGEQHKVKDLINLYDNKDQSNQNKMPSYSSIVGGSAQNKHGTTGGPNQSTTKFQQPITQSPTSSVQTPKPLSFSAVVSGSKHSNNPTANNVNKPGNYYNTPTLKPNTVILPSSITGNKNITPKPTGLPSSTVNNKVTSRPGSPVLPSSIINNKQNKNSPSSSTNSPTDSELQTLSEELLRKDSNNAARYITVNYQEKTSSQSKDDKAPLPLITVSEAAWNLPTIKKFLPLLDNYERDTLINEYVTPQERNEENAFMDVIMTTSVIRHLMTYLKDKGYVTPDPKQQRDFLKQLWFSLYSRGKGKISSSGFEHIFVSELKNGEVSGLHNWIYFSKEELENRVNYLGYLKYVQFNDKGTVLKFHFNQQGVDKPVNSMFIGTSPELEIALYTLCFVMRPDSDCPLKLGDNNVNVVTHTFRYRSKNLIGSAYPQI